MYDTKFKQTRSSLEEISKRLEQIQSEKEHNERRVSTTESENQSRDQEDEGRKSGENERKRTKTNNKQNSRRKPGLRSEYTSKKNSQAINRLRGQQTVRGRRSFGWKNRPVRGLVKKLGKRTNVPVSRPYSFDKGMMIREPTRIYSQNGDCLIFRGVEYVTAVKAYSSTASSPGNPGDIIFMQPVSPMFLPGTELYKEAQCWSKWRFKNMAFHYIPSCPSTLSGGLIGFGQTDVSYSVFGLQTDENTRIREALARRGAKMFHPFMETKIDIPIPESDSLLWYDTLVDDNAETCMPAQFYLMIDSPLIDPNGEELTALGQLLIDYEIEFCSKSIIDVPQPPVGGSVSVAGKTNTQVWASLNAGAQVGFLQSIFTSPITPNQIISLTWSISLFDITSAMLLNVYSPYSTGSTPLGQQGCILYGWGSTQTAFVFLSPSLEDALQKNTNRALSWVSTLTGTDSIEGSFDYTRWDLSSEL
jgi:hypothetical protein